MGRQFSPIWRCAVAIAVCLSLVLSSALNSVHHALAKSTIYVVTVGDTNIEDLFRNVFIKDFTNAFPQYDVNYTNILHGLNSQGLVVNKLVAARNAGQSSVNYDIFEDTPTAYQFPTGTTYKDFFMPLSSKDVPNAAKIDPLVEGQASGYGVAYRASAVTLAYNSQQISTPPKTFNDLIAWIKANPGKFTYCRPDEGGTGNFFVASAIRSVMDPKLLLKPWSKAAEASWPKAWALLKSIEPDLFQGGFHPAGNLPVLNLLAKGSITMATAWSDQGLAQQDKGLLPKYIHFTQIDPPLAGGPTFLSVPKLAQNPAGAKAFINFILQPVEQGKIATAIEGFPAIEFKYVPAAVVKHFDGTAKAYGYWPGIPTGSQWWIDLVKGWYANVPSH